ncbi:unnamed protein product [Ectocarpus fasciculatus]
MLAGALLSRSLRWEGRSNLSMRWTRRSAPPRRPPRNKRSSTTSR